MLKIKKAKKVIVHYRKPRDRKERKGEASSLGTVIYYFASLLMKGLVVYLLFALVAIVFADGMYSLLHLCCPWCPCR